jgi:hypothetical protein
LADLQEKIHKHLINNKITNVILEYSNEENGFEENYIQKQAYISEIL